MPYITCDGVTYSRYSKSEDAQNCIAKHKAEFQEKHTQCMQDTACTTEFYLRNEVLPIIIGLILIVWIISITGAFKGIFESIDKPTEK